MFLWPNSICLDQVLGTEILEFATAYVNDISVASTLLEEHCTQLNQVLGRLDEADIDCKI